MNQKKFVTTILVVIVVVIAVGGYIVLTKRQPHISTLRDSESVCRYVHRNFDKCNDYTCSADDKGEYWDVSYRCPGPPSFSLGQIYLLQVDKSSGAIKLEALSN